MRLIRNEKIVDQQGRQRIQRALFLAVHGWLSLALASALQAQTEIGPYVSEADLGALIGQKAKVEGVFHRDAFNAPGIVITGRVFYLLENPPNNRRYSFPQVSSYASVTGILYLYDGNIQYNELYDRIGRRYYFFSLDSAEIELGDPLRNRGEAIPVAPR